MSPLARSLLALACAALLHAVFAQNHPSRCSADKQGSLYGDVIKLPEIKIRTRDGPVVVVEIPDNCTTERPLLNGEKAVVCDWVGMPTVVIIDHLRKVKVTRTNFTSYEKDATLQVNQYCS